MTVQEFMESSVNENIDSVRDRVSLILNRINDISDQLCDKAKSLTMEERAGDQWMYDSLISFIEWELTVLSKKIEENAKAVKININNNKL